jgi:hypothetical protein
MRKNSPEYDRWWKKKNAEKIRAYHKQYYLKNRERIAGKKAAAYKETSVKTKRKTAADYHRMGLKNGFIWSGKLPHSVTKPTMWLCDNLHIVERTYKQIYDGTQCPLCKKKTKEVSYEAVERFRLSAALDSA